ncbi:MAG: glutamine synthetase family protein [Treponema sp.]|nr:glutamine synthetase family protein [Treponema sp.]
MARGVHPGVRQMGAFFRLEARMTTTAREVLDFVKENDVKFIRLAFCDLFGMQKNIAIMAEELESAFEGGVSFDAHSIKGFKDVTDSDLLLYPDPVTLNILPWRAGPGRVARFYCDIKNPDGTFFTNDGRTILKNAAARADKMGYTCKVGAECEFYLFKTDDNGDPTLAAFDKGGYLDVLPLDKGEDIRREICLTLAEMGMQPEASHHEQGPGQNEVDFKFSNALEAADNLQSFKTVVKAIAERNALFASFMPKPIPDAPGNGLHVNLSLNQNGRNIFKNADTGEHSAVSENFIAGILSKSREITLFLNPTANSYERLGKFDAPKYVSWSPYNRSQLIRIPAAAGEKVRMELRSPDPSVNPYLAFSLIISAGLDGIENKTDLPPPVNMDLLAAEEAEKIKLERLPDSLTAAIGCAGKSEFIKTVIGENLFDKFLEAKQAEAVELEKAENRNEFYRNRYFSVL